MNTGASGATALSSQRGQPLLGELLLAEAAHYAHPLWCGRRVDLLLQHGHRVGKTAHSVSAQLLVEAEAAADHVDVAVDQPGD